MTGGGFLMGAGWVAGATRARALRTRCLGPESIGEVAASPTLDGALRYLAATPYWHDINPGATPAEAQRTVSAALLWHLRVLAGWQPAVAAASVSVPARPSTAAAPANTALVHAETVYARAVRAAAEYAAARTAAELVGMEVVSTRHRVRALRRHWIPRLREALDGAGLALEQAEHEEGVRRRWAARSIEQ
ncbi:V-type ATP synthase subunit D [Streptomyces sp. ATMOS53]